MNIQNGQKVTITIKRFKIENGEKVIKNGFPVVEEIAVSGKVSGVVQEDWLCVYDKDGNHAIIDIRENEILTSEDLDML